MRFTWLVRASEQSEGSELQARVRPARDGGGKAPPRVIDGPFTETKELFAGYRATPIVFEADFA
jgi:hypothetical protein